MDIEVWSCLIMSNLLAFIDSVGGGWGGGVCTLSSYKLW